MGYFIVWLIFAFICMFVAAGKNRNPLGWFGLGFLGGFISLIVLLFLKTLPEEGSMKVCPFCAESILLEATTCKHCHKDLL